MQAALVMVKSDGTSKEVKLDRPMTLIGRDELCKLRIPAANVSRKHCEVKMEDDELIVRDLGSSNGTYVNGSRVKSAELAPGDLISVGPVVFVVRIDGHPKQIDAKDCYAAGAVAGDDNDDSGPQTAGGAGAASKSGSAPTIITSPNVGPHHSKPHHPVAPAAKPKAKDDDDEDISDILKGIDFGDDDDDAPKKK